MLDAPPCQSLQLVKDLLPQLRSPSLRACQRGGEHLILGHRVCAGCVPAIERLLSVPRDLALIDPRLAPARPAARE